MIRSNNSRISRTMEMLVGVVAVLLLLNILGVRMPDAEATSGLEVTGDTDVRATSCVPGRFELIMRGDAADELYLFDTSDGSMWKQERLLTQEGQQGIWMQWMSSERYESRDEIEAAYERVKVDDPRSDGWPQRFVYRKR